MIGINASSDRDSDPDARTAEVGKQKKRAPANSINTSRTNQGNDEGRTGDTKGNIKLCGCIVDTSGVEDCVLEVRNNSLNFVSTIWQVNNVVGQCVQLPAN